MHGGSGVMLVIQCACCRYLLLVRCITRLCGSHAPMKYVGVLLTRFSFLCLTQNCLRTPHMPCNQADVLLHDHAPYRLGATVSGSAVMGIWRTLSFTSHYTRLIIRCDPPPTTRTSLRCASPMRLQHAACMQGPSLLRADVPRFER